MQRSVWRNQVRSSAMVSVTGIGAMFLFSVALSWATLPVELDPEGPSCSFAADPGSGISGVGHEGIDWGLYPERVCLERVENGEREHRGTDAVFSPVRSLLFDLARFAGTVVAGLLATVAAAYRLRRHLLP